MRNSKNKLFLQNRNCNALPLPPKRIFFACCLWYYQLFFPRRLFIFARPFGLMDTRSNQGGFFKAPGVIK